MICVLLLCIRSTLYIALRLDLLSFVISCGLCVGHAKRILTTMMTPSPLSKSDHDDKPKDDVWKNGFKMVVWGSKYALSTSPTTWLRFHSVWVGLKHSRFTSKMSGAVVIWSGKESTGV